MSEENVQKQILIRIDEQYHGEIKSIAEQESVSMNKYIVDLIISNLNSKDDSEKVSDDSEIIEIFKAQIEEKDDQIKQLHGLLNQQQQLSLVAQKEKEKLLLEIDHIEENEENRPFWRRWFN